MIVLLDSTVLINALRSKLATRTILDSLLDDGHLLVTSAANIGEVYGGMRAGEEIRTEKVLATMRCYPVTEAIGRRAGNLQNLWARKGRTLTLIDMMVAATALEHDLPLMTDNRKDFPMVELRFYP